MNLLSLADWPRARIERLLERALAIKRDPGAWSRALAGKTLLMLFEKPSLRTRVSFEVAMLGLGGHAIHYDLAGSPWGHGRESGQDTARTASRYVDGFMARLKRAEGLAALAEGASVPVINGLTDLEHPCQALGDLTTLLERRGALAGLTLAYVGDANDNVTHSLLDGCAKVGVNVRVGCPPTVELSPAPAVLARARAFARESGARVEVCASAEAAVEGADAVYTDTWMSYHVPAERREARHRALAPFRVTAALMARAAPGAVFMHCLPAQRGVEQTDEVLDGPQSIVFDQAENRLHSEKALLTMLLAPTGADQDAPSRAAR